MFAAVLTRFGRLDVLLNNAGLYSPGTVEDLDANAWDQTMAVNLRGPFSSRSTRCAA